jgi:hypothetical protein
MSITWERGDIVAALGVIDYEGEDIPLTLAPYEVRPDVATEGCAWPVLDRVEPLTVSLLQCFWNVYVVLPGGQRDAVTLADKVLPHFLRALEYVGFTVDMVQPVALTATGAASGAVSTLNALNFQIHR